MKKGTLWEIPYYHGKANADPQVIADYLLSLSDVRGNPDPDHTRYEDIVLPEDKPIEPCIRELVEEICDKLSEISGKVVKVDLPVWTIIHGKDHATYPHNHVNDDRYWAMVYWVKVPPGGGSFQYYPLGLPYGPEKTIEPVEGEYILIPGYVLHGVKRNTSNEPRISLATNLYFE